MKRVHTGSLRSKYEVHPHWGFLPLFSLVIIYNKKKVKGAKRVARHFPYPRHVKMPKALVKSVTNEFLDWSAEKSNFL